MSIDRVESLVYGVRDWSEPPEVNYWKADVLPGDTRPANLERFRGP